MKTDLFTFWKHRSEVKFNKKVFVFIFCLFISFFFWLQINLSKKQIETLPIKIQFINLPKTLYGKIKSSDVLYVEVEADGYDLLKYKTTEMLVDFRKLKKDKYSDSYYYVPNVKTISKQLGSGFKLIRTVTDTMHIQ